MARVTDLFKALIKHGLKLSPKKCQFFKSELVYMGNVFKVQKGEFVITPIKTRVDAILNTPSPQTQKECKSFCGVVNYLSLFCPNLQKLLAPIYDLTRKGRPFVWTDKHQETFDTIKKLLAKSPVLSLPDGIGRYTLYSDTSKTHAGSALWQMQKGKHRLIGYASKSLPKACVNYSITELEMTGLLVNMENWKFYLGKKDFDAAVDHRAIPYIVESKELPTTDRIIRLLQRMARFNFHLYYVKGKDMILCDFLSRIKADDSNPHELIPIAFHYIGEQVSENAGLQIVPVQFNPKQILDIFYRIQEVVGYAAMKTCNSQNTNAYMVMTRGQAKAAGAVAPQVHGANKPLDPDKKPEKDISLQKQIIPGNILAGSSVKPTAIPNKPMAPPPVQLPVKVTPPTPVTPQKVATQNVFKTPQISQTQRTPQTIPGTSASVARSPGMFQPRNVTPQLPNKVMRTPIPGSTSTNIPQSIHSTPISSTTGYTPVRKQLNFDLPNLDSDTNGGETYVNTPNTPSDC